MAFINLNQLLLSIIPFHLSEPTANKKTSCSPNIKSQSLIKFMLSIFGLNSIIILFLDVLSFSLTFIFLFKLYSGVQSSVLSLNILIILGALIVLKYIISVLMLRFDISNRNHLIHYISKEFLKSEWQHKNYQIIHQLLGRDLMVLLDFLSVFMKLFFFPIAMIIGLSFIYMLEGAMGIFAVSILTLFVGMSWYIAKKSMFLAKAIYALSKSRIDISSLFIKYRPYLKNWNESKKLDEIEQITKEEINLRNKDSFWKSLDLYLIVFGSAIPIILILMHDIWISKLSNNYLTVILWFSPPLIALIMEMGRFFSDYTMASQAFNELSTNLRLNDTPQPSEIILNDTWEIWDGSIEDNILHELNTSGMDFLNILNLKEELFDSTAKCRSLRFLGENVSQGQKVRILIIRALNIAIAEDLPLKIEIPLNSLDPISCKNLQSLFDEVGNICKINIPEAQQCFLKQQITRINSYHNSSKIELPSSSNEDVPPETPKSIKSGIVLKLFSTVSLLFIIPAFCLNLNAAITSSDLSLTSKAQLMSAIFLFSLIGAICLGLIIEGRIRTKALTLKLKILMHDSLRDIADNFQRITRDFTITVERVSWYIHDISWYLSLAVVGFGAVVYMSGVKGALLNTLFIIFLFYLYILFSKPIAEARLKSVEDMNIGIQSIANISATSNIKNATLHTKRHKWNEHGFNKLCHSNLNMVITKVTFSNILDLSMGVFILCITAISMLNPSQATIIIFVLNSILAMQYTILNLFQAITGLKSQIVSYHRLEHESKINDILNAPPKIEIVANEFIIPSCEHNFLNVQYSEIKMFSGHEYSITGPSGQGKTEYLRTISNFYDSSINFSKQFNNSEVKVLYTSKDSLEVLSWLCVNDLLQFYQDKMEHDNYKIIILDESLANLELFEVKEFIRLLSDVVLATGAIVLLVDHRLEMQNQIKISEIIK